MIPKNLITRENVIIELHDSELTVTFNEELQKSLLPYGDIETQLKQLLTKYYGEINCERVRCEITQEILNFLHALNDKHS